MSFCDNKFGELFPTRTGEASGTANERKMLDAIGGSDSFRTRIETTDSGATVMLRTKNGMPQFSTTEIESAKKSTTTKPKQQRTFVFSDRAAPAVGVVANLAASNTLLRVGDPIETRQYVSYSVLNTKTPKAGMKAVSWNDVLRLDSYGTALGYRVRFNSDHHVPDYISIYGEKTVPGFPMEVGGRVYVANDWYQFNTGTAYVDQMGVIEYDGVTGAVVAFHPVVGDTLAFLIDYVSGIYVDGDTFNFYWYGANPSLHGAEQLACHTSITPVAGSSPTITHHQTATTFANFDASGMVFVPQSTVVTDSVIGSFFAALQQSFSGDHGPLNQYNYSYWVGGEYPDKPTPIYTAESTMTWSSSVNWTDTKAIGYGMAELVCSRSVVGSENWQTIGGGGGTQPLSQYYVISEGNTSTWSRSTQSLLNLHHVQLDVDLFSVDFQMTSDMNFGEFKKATSSTFDYSAWDYRTDRALFGGYYSPDNAIATAISRSQVANNVQQFNASKMANASTLIPPDFSHAPYNVTQSTSYSSTGDAVGSRHDSHTLTVKSRDYIYLDVDEEVSLYLEGTYTESRGDTSVPPLPINQDGGYDTFNSEFTIEYVLNFRGMVMRYPVYHHVDTTNSGSTWSAQLNLAPVWSNPIYIPSANQRFSLLHVPQNPEPVFTPLYTCQNRCPWMAYTTKAEEAAGATPELYIDAELSALAYGHGSIAGWIASMNQNVTFAAHQLTRILSNYIGYYSPLDAWNTLLFPTSTRIQYAKGLSNPWPAAIGAGFSGGSRVTITRI